MKKVSSLFSLYFLDPIWSYLLPVLNVSSLKDLCQQDLNMWEIIPLLYRKISQKGCPTHPPRSSISVPILQPLIFTYLVTIFTTFTNSLLFAEFSKHLSSYLTLPSFATPSSWIRPSLGHRWFCILLLLIPMFLAASAFLWMFPSVYPLNAKVSVSSNSSSFSFTFNVFSHGQPPTLMTKITTYEFMALMSISPGWIFYPMSLNVPWVFQLGRPIDNSKTAVLKWNSTHVSKTYSSI